MTDEKKYNQVMRYSEEELQLIKDTFADNWTLLNALRKMFLQMELTAVDLSAIQTNVRGRPEVMKLVHKHFLPELSDDVPFALQSDFLLVGQIKELAPASALLHLKALKLTADYIRQQLGGKKGIRFSDLAELNLEDDIVYINMLARNTILNHIESKLNELKILAGKKEETPEETIKKLRKDSAK